MWHLGGSLSRRGGPGSSTRAACYRSPGGKKLTRALTLLEQAIKLDPTAKAAYNSLGNVYYQQRRYQQALAMYQKALAIDPDYAKPALISGVPICSWPWTRAPLMSYKKRYD